LTLKCFDSGRDKETAEKGNPEEILTSIDKVFSDYDKIYLNEKDKKRFLNGDL